MSYKNDNRRHARLWQATPKKLVLEYWVTSQLALRARVHNKEEAEQVIAASGVTQVLDDETTARKSLETNRTR